VGYLGSCTDLFVPRNSLTGTVPTEFGNMRSLQILELGFNFLSGSVPTELDNCVNLRALGVTSNEGLSGRIDSILDGLSTQLTTLLAGKTGIGGSIPTTVGRFSALRKFNLDQNHQVTGTMPSEIGLASNLIQVTFRSNQLWGTIPTEIGRLGAATQLQFGGNNFTGTLAPELAGWTSLEILDVSENMLSGSPSVLANLPALRKCVADRIVWVSLPLMSSLFVLFALFVYIIRHSAVVWQQV